jgi:hypothetical protein
LPTPPHPEQHVRATTLFPDQGDGKALIADVPPGDYTMIFISKKRKRSSWIFGLFVWECIMNRPDDWQFCDPDLSSRDPNKEITGKVYFEQ